MASDMKPKYFTGKMFFMGGVYAGNTCTRYSVFNSVAHIVCSYSHFQTSTDMLSIAD